MKKFYLFVIIVYFLTGCQSAKDALTLKKKNNSDEFLVEKKSPLVLPPDYGKLPVPDESKNNEINKVNNEMKVTLGKDELKINETIKDSKPSSLEKSILKKIK
tara:strand:- start:104 stop:412 length:309 start_codon:yes stop_codon:yes gene_type:complete